MDTQLILIGIVFISIGAAIGYLISTKTNLIDKFTKEGRQKYKVLKNPDLLLEKLKEVNEGGDIIDDGKKVNFSVVEEDGKRRLKVTLSEIPRKKKVVSNPEQKPPKSVPKSRTKKAQKKPIKKTSKN